MSVLTMPEFWKILEESGSINKTRGMERFDFHSANGSLTTFSKNHSYGEYIFDWAWAQAYERYGIPYYPKLTSMVPFTPATAKHFQGPQNEWSELLSKHDQLLTKHSSAHFLFTTNEEQGFLKENGYLLRDSFQYHFFNEDYQDFEDFLNHLKTKKAKNIRQERKTNKVEIKRLTGQNLIYNHGKEMYDFYLMTIQEKNAIPYLSESFFSLLIKNIPNNILYVRATINSQLVAGSLFYYDKKTLYGRYWGANTYLPNLHFELCYYQGIEFCIEQGLKTFEAGAQGEHKISRGFKPTLTQSAHKINHPEFSKLIKTYIEDEKKQIAQSMIELSELLPFKN